MQLVLAFAEAEEEEAGDEGEEEDASKASTDGTADHGFLV